MDFKRNSFVASMATLFGIPGFTYSLKHWLEVQDALKMIGLG